MKELKLTPKQDAFVLAYLETGNASEAYRRAYDVSNMKPATINNRARELLRVGRIAARLEEAREMSFNKATMDRAAVLNLITELATADASQLMELQRRCCRQCWGVGHVYQWKNPIEFAFEVARVTDNNAAQQLAWEADAAIGSARPQPKPEPLPSDIGGYGFDVFAQPNPECPVCQGEGHEVAHFKDTRRLKGAAKRLFAGVKRTKDGLEIKTRDQDKALEMLARAHGIVKAEPGVVLNQNNAPGSVAQTVVIAADPLDAARQYQDFIKG